nr:MAG TPA: hypothetical protein [Caudoviricetes sp.]
MAVDSTAFVFEFSILILVLLLWHGIHLFD